ncbi:type II secretion system F family protein [Ideonella sp. YS5]|uniref:type II secretion system F family protein n=1 Tax=Ideonella sp. YS5 TaxID=3453714 RepID=UPI003EEEF94B
MDPSLALFAVVAFLAVVLALEGLYNLWASKSSPQAKRIADRLASLHGESRTEMSLERVQERRRMGWLQDLLDRSAGGTRLSRWVQSSGKAVSAVEMIVLSLALGLVGLALPPLLGRPAILGWGLGVALFALPWWRISVSRAKRVARFEFQFPEALDLMGRAMRAGHSFPTAIRMVGDEMPEPMGRDFRVLSDELNYGVPTPDALANLSDRVPLPDVRYFAVAVMIQRESGGNLAELLDSISSIVRARLKLLGEVRTLSAEGKLSAQILVALPFGVALMVNIVNPKFLSVLWTDPLGLRMVGVAMFMMVLGVLWMRSIVRIRV